MAEPTAEIVKKQRDDLLSELKTAVSVIEQLAPKGLHRGVVDLALYRFRQVIANAEGLNVP